MNIVNVPKNKIFIFVWWTKQTRENVHLNEVVAFNQVFVEASNKYTENSTRTPHMYAWLMMPPRATGTKFIYSLGVFR